MWGHLERCGFTLICFLSYWHTAYQVLMSEGRISTGYSKDYVYKYVGERLALNCTLHDSSSWKAEDLFFTVDNDFCIIDNDSVDSFCRVPTKDTKQLDGKTLRLNLDVTSERNAGEYLCWLNTAGSMEQLVDSVDVYVQYPPEKVKKEDILCEVFNWDESLTCHMNYGIAYIYNSAIGDLASSDMAVSMEISTRNGNWVPCPHFISPLSKTPSCVWSDRYFLGAASYVLRVHITNTERNESQESYLPIRVHEVVKPSAVLAVWAEEKNRSCVLLAWNHSQVHRTKYYRLQLGSGKPVYVHSTQQWLCGLAPYTTYSFSLECRATDGSDPYGLWSDRKAVSITTAEAEPESSFQVYTGGYILHPCNSNGKRNITILLKAVPPNKRNGQIIGYRLKYNGIELDVDEPSPTSALVPEVSCDANLWISVFSRTKVGASKTNSRLQVVPEQDGFLANFAVETSDTGLRAVWAVPLNITSAIDKNSALNGSIQDADNVTVFWCRGDRRAPSKCQTEVNSRSTPFADGQLLISDLSGLGNADPEDFVFGISHHGQAIVWTSCLFKSQALIRSPEDVKASGVQGGLYVTWRSQQCSDTYPVHVTGYRIHMCQLHNCQGTEHVIEVEGRDEFRHTVDAEADTLYNVSVETVTFHKRVGPRSEPVTASWHFEEEEVPVIALIVTAVVVVIIITLIFLLCKCYQVLQRTKKKFRRPYGGAHKPGSEDIGRDNYTGFECYSHRSTIVTELSKTYDGSAMTRNQQGENITENLHTSDEAHSDSGLNEESSDATVGDIHPHPVCPPGQAPEADNIAAFTPASPSMSGGMYKPLEEVASILGIQNSMVSTSVYTPAEEMCVPGIQSSMVPTSVYTPAEEMCVPGIQSSMVPTSVFTPAEEMCVPGIQSSMVPTSVYTPAEEMCVPGIQSSMVPTSVYTPAEEMSVPGIQSSMVPTSVYTPAEEMCVPGIQSSMVPTSVFTPAEETLSVSGIQSSVLVTPISSTSDDAASKIQSSMMHKAYV